MSGAILQGRKRNLTRSEMNEEDTKILVRGHEEMQSEHLPGSEAYAVIGRRIRWHRERLEKMKGGRARTRARPGHCGWEKLALASVIGHRIDTHSVLPRKS